MSQAFQITGYRFVVVEYVLPENHAALILLRSEQLFHNALPTVEEHVLQSGDVPGKAVLLHECSYLRISEPEISYRYHIVRSG